MTFDDLTFDLWPGTPKKQSVAIFFYKITADSLTKSEIELSDIGISGTDRPAQLLVRSPTLTNTRCHFSSRPWFDLS